MKRTWIILICAGLFAACNNQTETSTTEESTADTPVESTTESEKPERSLTNTASQDRVRKNIERAREETLRENRNISTQATYFQTGAEISTFGALALASGYKTIFESEEMYTVFAPKNHVFELMKEEDLVKLKRGKDPKILDRFIGAHVVQGKYSLIDFDNYYEFVNMNGDTINVSHVGGLFMNGIESYEKQVETQNGPVILLEGLLAIPEGMQLLDGQQGTK